MNPGDWSEGGREEAKLLQLQRQTEHLAGIRENVSCLAFLAICAVIVAMAWIMLILLGAL